MKQKDELHRLKLEVVKYEQKYNFIDLDKLMEEMAASKTLHAEAKERADLLQMDLFTLREKILDITQPADKVSPKKKGKRPPVQAQQQQEGGQ